MNYEYKHLKTFLFDWELQDRNSEVKGAGDPKSKGEGYECRPEKFESTLDFATERLIFLAQKLQL